MIKRHTSTNDDDLSPRERWGTCCPNDPMCGHSFLDCDELSRWLDAPMSEKRALAMERS